MSSYLFQNFSTPLSKMIFSVRSGTLNIKTWNLWKNTDNICIGCKLAAETMSNFMTCLAYCKETEEKDWKIIIGNDYVKQLKIARTVEKRMEMR